MGNGCRKSRRMETKLIVQMRPEPLDKPVLLNRRSLSRRQGFGAFDVAAQAIKIDEQKWVVAVAESAFFYFLQQSNSAANVPARQISREQVG